MSTFNKPVLGLALIAVSISASLSASELNTSKLNVDATKTPFAYNTQTMKSVVGMKAPNRIANEYIVLFHDKTSSEQINDVVKLIDLELDSKAPKTRQLSFIKGFSGKIPAKLLPSVLNNPAVKLVEANRTIALEQVDMGHMSLKTATPADSWGIDRIDQTALPLDGIYAPEFQGLGVHAYVLSTGIYLDHNEFTGRANWAYTASDITDGDVDGNGHGTHLAGTVGGTIWGVAKGVNLHAVKVLDNNGQGTLAGLIEGINYVTNNHQSPAVATLAVNLSYSPTLESAVSAAVAAGVNVVVPSGDLLKDACNYSPSSNTYAITVASTWSDDRASHYSNYGNCVDIMAPGLYVKSAWPITTSANNSISHSPVSAAHVAGAAALVLEEHPSFTPSQVKSQILNDGVSNTLTEVTTGSPNLLLNVDNSETSTPPTPTETEKSGPNENIALIGTNGLTASSYSASTLYNVAPYGEAYSVEGAFDGWRHRNDTTPMHDDAGAMEKGAAWYSNPSEEDQWLQVDFGSEVSLTGTRIYYKNTKLYSTQYITVQSSNDGVNFTDHYTYYNWRYSQIVYKTFSEPVVGRYIRLVQHVDRGDPRTGVIHVAELEYYGEFTGN